MASERRHVRLAADKEVKLREYLEARSAATAWFNKARELRHQLMEEVEPSDNSVVDVLSGDLHVEIVPVSAETVDVPYLRANHPETYKASLTKNVSYHIREVSTDEQE